MSDLSATQCGCPQPERSCNNNWIWIVLIVMLFSNCCGNDRRGCGCNICDLFKGDCCETMLMVVLLLSCCGCKSMC